MRSVDTGTARGINQDKPATRTTNDDYDFLCSMHEERGRAFLSRVDKTDTTQSRREIIWMELYGADAEPCDVI